MKSKLYKIFGVALTVVMLASLMVFAIPASANPGDNEWTKFAYPKQGADGKWFFDPTITAVGPIAMAINGNLYCAADPTVTGQVGDYHLMKSTDGGRTWSVTDYEKDLDGNLGTAGRQAPGQIVDIACSSENADVVYVADADYVYWTQDGGSVWTTVAGESSDALVFAGAITALDVGYIAGKPYVFVSTANTTYGGSVYLIDQTAYLSGWTNMNIQLYGAYDVYAVNVAPDFETSHKIFAVITRATTPKTLVVTNSGTVGAWTKFGGYFYTDWPVFTELEIVAASDICFPDNFDNAELFVGVSDKDNTTPFGSVHRVVKDIAYSYRLGNFDTTINKDVISLQVTGDVGATMLMAGAQDSADVFYSADDGESWDAPSKAPSGSGPTYVLMAADFIDSTTPSAWATTASDEGAVSYTIDGGDLWNQISLISTDMDNEVLSFSHYPDYKTSGKLFMVTTDGSDDSLWRYDGKYWERVVESTVLDDDFYWVEVSPTIATDKTVYLTDWPAAPATAPTGFRSINEGQSWKELRAHAAELYGAIVIDAETVLTGGIDKVYRTTDHGNRVWAAIDPGIDGNIYWFARSGDNVLCGSDDGEVALSKDLGKTWAQLGADADITADDYTYVAFDTGYATNSIVYAACDNDIYRFTVGTSTAWKDIDGSVAIGNASGIATADGCLYAADYADTAGMWRSVDPTATAPVFEQVGSTFKLTTGANIWWLKTTSASSTSGSNVLWALDFGWGDTLENTIWTYTDNLVGPVALATPVSGTALGRITTATLTWKELSTAVTDYDLMLYSDAAFRAAYKVVDETITAAVSADEVYVAPGLDAGTTFYWKVRATAPLNSKWSTPPWTFGTAMGAAEWNPFEGPVSEAPYPGQTNVPLRPAFAWNAADWATAYELEVSTAPGTTAGGYFVDALVGMTGTNALVNTAWQCNIDLDYSTTYYWHVKAVKGTTSASNWATGVFTTIAAPAAEVWTCPIDGLTFDSQAALQAHNAAAHAPVIPTTPTYIWIIVIIGAVLVIAVIVLIVTTRRTP